MADRFPDRKAFTPMTLLHPKAHPRLRVADTGTLPEVKEDDTQTRPAPPEPLPPSRKERRRLRSEFRRAVKKVQRG